MTQKRKKLKIILTRKDVVLRQIAEQLGCTPGNVTNVLAGRWKSERVVQAVADALGIDPKTLIRDYIPSYPKADAA